MCNPPVSPTRGGGVTSSLSAQITQKSSLPSATRAQTTLRDSHLVVAGEKSVFVKMWRKDFMKANVLHILLAAYSAPPASDAFQDRHIGQFVIFAGDGLIRRGWPSLTCE